MIEHPNIQNDQALGAVTFRDYIRVLFRHKWVILTSVVVVMLTVYFGLKLKTPVYEASVKMLITAEKNVESPYYRDLVGYQNVQRSLTQSEIVKSKPVMERAVRALNLWLRPLGYERTYSSPLKQRLINYQIKKMQDEFSKLTKTQQDTYRMRMAVKDLKERTEVEPIRDTNMFLIKVRDFDPIYAMLTANVVSRSYVIFDLQQQLAELTLKYGEKHTTVSQLEDYIQGMTANLNGKPLSDIEAIGPASVKIIEQASIPFKPSGTPKILTLVLAFFMSVFLGVMLAFVFEYMDQSFKTPQDIEQHLGLPMLGSIPQRQLTDRTIIRNTRSRSVYTHFYQNLADQLYLVIRDRKIKSVLFTSTVDREGADKVLANLGLFFSQAGHKVLLIDADLRRPVLHRLFRMKLGKGLADVLEDKAPLQGVTYNPSKNLFLVTAGQTELNPVILLDSGKVNDVMAEEMKKYEIILVHCPGLKDSKDAVVLSSHVDAAVLVIDEGTTRRQVARSAVKQLTDKEGLVLGAVLNNRTFPIPRFVYERV